MQPGDTIGAYRIDSEIGRGGMGVVYLGHDTRLDRKVAIKALPEHFAADPERLARFEREAKTLAALNHPNLAGIHGVEVVDGHRYLVLEYVEGETLADRLDRGALPLDEALEVCAKIAAGLEAAHESGVVHRDLKPANVRITPDGDVKVLDFGLARIDEGTSLSSSVSHAPTLTTPPPAQSPTVAGAILGTAPYMSPEQARGRRVDRRSDIWSFGVVLYECLTGASPFIGETATDSIGAILHKDVDLSRLPRETPPLVRHVLLRCLERDRNQRLRDIGDARIELENAHGAGDAFAAPAQNRRAVAPIAVACVLIGAALGAGAWSALAPSAPVAIESKEPRRYAINLPEEYPLAPPSAYPFGVARLFFDISPDGRTLAYTALINGRTSICLLDLSTGRVESLRGGEGGYNPKFSRNGQEIAFFAGERLYKLDLTRGGDRESLATVTSAVGLDWSSDGRIYFSPAENSPIMSVPSTGGDIRAETDLGTRGSMHRWPILSPDGRTLLYTDYVDVPVLMAARLGQPDAPIELIAAASGGRITPSEHLLFTRGNRLLATSIDPVTLQVKGDPKTIVSNVRQSYYQGQYAISSDGALFYADGLSDGAAEFVWVDREGTTQSLDLGLRNFVAFDLSPDGRYLATPIWEGRDCDIWVYDLQRPQTPARITFGGVFNNTAWSTDGRYLIFSSANADGRATFFAKDMRSGAPAFAFHEGAIDGATLQYLSDAKELLFSVTRADQASDLMRGVVDLTQGEGATLENIQPVRATRNGEPFGSISPDRKWIVANSNETGRWELYLSTYPDIAQRIQISSAGGEEPRWTDDGSRVVYRWNDTWYEVEVTTEPALAISPPRVIARGPYINVPGYSWDMTADGERFLFLEGPQQDAPVTQLQVITNFDTELNRLVPAPE